MRPVSTERRLAAILVADVVGYSRLMGQDESGTLRRIKAARRDVVDPNIHACRGRVVKTTGDGILVEFPSAVEAVRCAVAVQRTMAERNAELAPDKRIEFRVGVHQGDIVVDDQDIFGDGVNVAARLETLSEGGGVCISGRVHEDLAGRLELPFDDQGEQQVKNIARPVRVYALGREAIASLSAPRLEDGPRPTGVSGRQGAATSTWLRSKPMRWAGVLFLALAATGILAWQIIERRGTAGPATADLSGEARTQPRGPALAVLPFDNLSGDPSQDFFSDGISEELVTVLSNFDDLRVLARNTTFVYKKKAIDIQELGRQLKVQYVVEGSFRRVADQISVTAQLIDAHTGTHLWAQTYERPIASSGLLAIQDDVAQRIGAAVGDTKAGAVAKAEFERTSNQSATELSSYECVALANQAANIAERVRRARTCLEATVKRDPTYAEAWAGLARILAVQRWWGTGLASPNADDIDKRAHLIPRIVEAGNRAVELAPESASAHWSLFMAYSATCQPERMRVEADRVLAINPNDAGALGSMGNTLVGAGVWDYGQQLAERVLRLQDRRHRAGGGGPSPRTTITRESTPKPTNFFYVPTLNRAGLITSTSSTRFPISGGLTRLGRKSLP